MALYSEEVQKSAIGFRSLVGDYFDVAEIFFQSGFLFGKFLAQNVDDILIAVE